MTDQTRGCELGVALDELETDTELVGDGTQERRFARAGRALDQDVPVDGQGGDDELDLAPAPDEPPPSRSTSDATSSMGCESIIGYAALLDLGRSLEHPGVAKDAHHRRLDPGCDGEQRHEWTNGWDVDEHLAPRRDCE